MNEYIHACSNVQVAELKRARERDDHRRVDIAQAALSVCFFRGALLELIFQSAGRERLGRYAAGQRRVVVDVEFQQVEERVVDEVDRAVDLLLYAEEELQRAAGFIASREWDVRQLACSVGDMFAGVTEYTSQHKCSSYSFRRLCRYIHGPVQAAHGDLLANAIPLLNERLLGSLCGGERGVKSKQDAHEEGETADHHENQKMRPKGKLVQSDVYARS